jgi:aminoglycoside phosphotransferase (APT) family kinase protein
MSRIDRAGKVRDGEALDLASLRRHMLEHLPVEGELQLLQFPSGYSNLTYLIRCGDDELVLRRPPIGADIKSGHDMSREFRILSALHPVFQKVPKPLLFCRDRSVIGSDFYLMERVRGTILRRSAPNGLDGRDRMARLSEDAADCLADIHAVDLETSGLTGLGRSEGYVRRQIEGWTRRYGRAKTDALPEMDAVAAWLAGNMPEEVGTALIHNDYKYDNLVLDPETWKLRAVLDWEMATVGCPLMDLGAALGYWVEAGDSLLMQQVAFCPTYLPGNLSRRAFAERYAARAGISLPGLLFYYVYGVWRIAVIVQQIYARYKAGHTRDPRFAGLGMLVKLLSMHASERIDRDQI